MSKSFITVLLLTGLICGWGCRKLVPLDKDTIDPSALFITKKFEPVLGRHTMYRNIFNYGQSTLPLQFEIMNMRRFDGSPAPELTDSVYPVMAWKNTAEGAYTGLEKSLEEIESKRYTEFHRLFEMRKFSGEILVWPGINTSKLLTQPDSGYKFDVKVSNSGAVSYYYDFRFMPYKSIPYDPNNYDLATGMPSSPTMPGGLGALDIGGIYRSKDNNLMSASEVDVMFNRMGNGNTLSFRFLDSAYRPIDPGLFAATDWTRLVHGFDMQQSAAKVTYSVAYPVPVVQLPTRYTNSSGTRANVHFGFYRVGPGGQGIDAFLNFQFAIYEKGDWEIVFHFKNTSPKFTND